MPMPSTGLFNIKSSDVASIDLDNEVRVSAMTAECLSCGSTTGVEAGKGLESLPGGVVITCCECGSRQAVSSSLFSGATSRS